MSDSVKLQRAIDAQRLVASGGLAGLTLDDLLTLWHALPYPSAEVFRAICAAQARMKK